MLDCLHHLAHSRLNIVSPASLRLPLSSVTIQRMEVSRYMMQGFGGMGLSGLDMLASLVSGLYRSVDALAVQ